MTDGYQTIPALMLKDTDYAELLHGVNDIYTVNKALVLCDALEEIVMVWNEGLDAFGLTSQEKNSPYIFGTVALVRLLFKDLAQRTPQVTSIEANEILGEAQFVFLLMARSYAKTPMLAQWYVSLPVRVSETYDRLRRQR